jgi:thymidylate synthase
MTQYHDTQYLNLLTDVLNNGVWKENRTGIRTKSVFGRHMRFDLRDGSIPLLTTKKMHTKSIIHEILWYLTGSTNIKYLQDNGVRIWNEWADKNGELGPVYGRQWRYWKNTKVIDCWDNPIEVPDNTTLYNIKAKTQYIDQIAVLIDTLRNNPDDRRMIVTAWNVADLPGMKLPPCHYSFQCYVSNGELSLIMNQRSVDSFLGLPYNIVQYSMLLRMLAEVVGLKPGEFIWYGGDIHIYENHLLQVNLQLDNSPYESPTFKFARKIDDIDDFKFEDFIIENYQSHSTIKAGVAI